eukprot:670341-Alexandrium_andersonii.AAC.1
MGRASGQTSVTIVAAGPLVPHAREILSTEKPTVASDAALRACALGGVGDASASFGKDICVWCFCLSCDTFA